MTLITTYAEAAALIREYGFLLLSRNPWGLVSLEEVTAPEAWHTGDAGDPWLWKDRLASEKQAAYARVFGRRPGFIAPEWYQRFLAAYRPAAGVAERYQSGELGHLDYRLYTTLQGCGTLNTHDLKTILQVSGEAKRDFENALVGLQGTMDITVAGASRRLNRNGEPYGWLVSEYTTVGQWAGPEMLAGSRDWERAEAGRQIAARAQELCPGLSAREAGRLLGLSADR